MIVVAAGVHHAHFLAVVGRLLRGLERHVHLLGHRQAIHVGAQRDDAAGLAALQDADDAGAADAGLHLHAQRAEVIRDDLGGADFLQPQFGMLVEIAAPGDDLREDFGGRAVDCRGHRIRGRLGYREPGRGGEQGDEHDM